MPQHRSKGAALRFLAALLALPSRLSAAAGFRNGGLAAVAAAMLLGCGAQGASLQWAPLQDGSGSDGSGVWATGTTDWSNGTMDEAWVSGDNAVFGDGGAPGTVTVSGTQTAGSLTFNLGYTLSGGSITLANQTAVTAVTVAGAGNTTTINGGTLANFSAFNIASGDELILSSTNTSTGTGNTNFLDGANTSGGLGLTGGGTLELTAGTFDVTAAPQSNVNNGSPATGGLVIAGSSELFTGANGFEVGRGSGASGLVTISGGSIVDGGGSQFTVGRSTGASGTGALVVNSGTFQNTNPTTSQSLSVMVGRDGANGIMSVNGGAVTVNDILAVSADSVNELNFGTMAITGGTTSLGSLVFNASDGNESGAAIAGVTGGGGTLNMSGGTLYIGTGNSTDASHVSTTLGGVGIINLNTGGAQTGATITLTGGTIGATSAWASSLNMTLANTVTFQSENLITTANTPSGTAETITLSGALTNGTSAGTLAATGNGELVLSGPNTYSGGTTITSGTVSFAQADSLPATGAVTVGAAGTLAANAGGTGEFTSGTGAGTIGGLITGPSYTAGAILAINTSDSNGSYSVSTSAAVPSTVILQELGTGTVSLTGHIDAPSILIASGGTFNLSGGSAATDFLNSSPQSPDGAGTLNITGGTYNSTGPNLNFGTGGVDMTGGAWTFSGAFAIGRGTNANGLFTLAGGTISDSGGQLTVGRTTGVGVFTITSGTFSDSLPTTNQSVAVFIGRDVDTGSVLTVNGGSATVTDILDLAANNGATGITNGTLTIAGGIVSIGSIAFNGSDTNAASGGVAHAISASTATDSGILNVTGGTLYIGNPTDAANIAITLGSVGIVNLNSGSTGATINLSGGTVGANSNWSSSLNMGLSNSNGGVTFQTANAGSVAENISLSGALSGTGGFTETGGGTLTLSGNSTYSGATTVSAGTLVVSGSLNGTASLSVNGGTAELESPNGINSAAHLSLSAGTLETLASQTETLGDLTLGAGRSTLTLGATGSILNFANSSGDTWTGALSISGWNGASAGGGSDRIFIGSTEDLTSQQLADITFINGSLNGNSFTSDSAVQLPDGELVAAVVPEPGAWEMLLGGLATLAGLRRSYRRRISRSSM